MSDTERKQALRRLLRMEAPVDVLGADIRSFSWDSEELVVLTEEDLLSVLNRFVDHAVDADQLEGWANLVESREDIRVSTPLAKTVLHDLANPDIQGELTLARVATLISRLTKVAG